MAERQPVECGVGAAQNQVGGAVSVAAQNQDQFNMGLTGQQQAMAEWQAQQQQANWMDQFNYQQGRDQWEQGLARAASTHGRRPGGTRRRDQ